MAKKTNKPIEVKVTMTEKTVENITRVLTEFVIKKMMNK